MEGINVWAVLVAALITGRAGKSLLLRFLTLDVHPWVLVNWRRLKWRCQQKHSIE